MVSLRLHHQHDHTTTFAGNAQNGRLPNFYPDVNKARWRPLAAGAQTPASNVNNALPCWASNATAIQPGTDADGTVVNFIIQS
jgi:hypothetical protein